MSDEYEKYEIECRKLQDENEVLLAEFKDWLVEKGLGAKTIEKHVSNVGIYINQFLLHTDPIAAKNGAVEIGMFLSYWFIRKALWASKDTIRSAAASLKKFYGFMNEKGLVEKDDFDSMKDEIKECMHNWLATMERYEDPDNDDPFNMRFL